MPGLLGEQVAPWGGASHCESQIRNVERSPNLESPLGRPQPALLPPASLPPPHCQAFFWALPLCPPYPRVLSVGLKKLLPFLPIWILSVCRSRTQRRRVKRTLWHLGMEPKSAFWGRGGRGLLIPSLPPRTLGTWAWLCTLSLQLYTRQVKALGLFLLLSPLCRFGWL
jgi:hypothetical protein